MRPTVLTTEVPGLPKRSSGKVRDIYELPNALALVTTDRISAYDVVMADPIPDKGRVLNALSRYWFLQLRPLVPNHYMTRDVDYILARMAEAGAHVSSTLRAQFDGRSMLVLKAEVFPVECVVRGYLAGSLFKEYCDADGPASGAVIHGIRLPAGMRESDRLPEPIFTPATKAETGHDENISFDQAAEIVGGEHAEALRAASLKLYLRASELAAERGIIIADTKFEFGMHQGVLILVDEALTPDSSRFWDAATYEPGKPQPSFDKQYLRDWLTQSGWNREPPPPPIPAEIIHQTAARYREAYRRITGTELPE